LGNEPFPWRSWADAPGRAGCRTGAAEHDGSDDDGKSLHRVAVWLCEASNLIGFSGGDQTKLGRTCRIGEVAGWDGTGEAPAHLGVEDGMGSV